MRNVLSTLMREEACEAFLVYWIDPLIEQLLETASNKLDSLFRDRHRHATTYNHYFSDNLQKNVNSRYEKRLIEVLWQMFPDDYNGRSGPKDLYGVCTMMSKTIPDMDSHFIRVMRSIATVAIVAFAGYLS